MCFLCVLICMFSLSLSFSLFKEQSKHAFSSFLLSMFV